MGWELLCLQTLAHDCDSHGPEAGAGEPSSRSSVKLPENHQRVEKEPSPSAMPIRRWCYTLFPVTSVGNSGNGYVQIIQSCYFHAWFFAKEPSSCLLGPKSEVLVRSCLAPLTCSWWQANPHCNFLYHFLLYIILWKSSGDVTWSPCQYALFFWFLKILAIAQKPCYLCSTSRQQSSFVCPMGT
jgi:hypothetical protein